ncbi:MAG: mechanosensitive ion channel family protein [Bacteroidales bacterium]|nr:mechanosensitive ion channel family protein [Bacteroidales bacterium]MBR1850691.1 mechanosensitive ion channel family protein [Bacteroidales bacterium]
MAPTDDNTLLTAQALAGVEKSDILPEATPVTQTLQVVDSIKSTMADSLHNATLADIGQMLTGQNTLLHDGLSALLKMTLAFVPKLIVAILILWIGMKLAKMLKRVIVRALDRRNAEASLKSFLSSLVDLLLKAMIIIMAMDVIGIKATSFIALLGAMGLAIGMALQGTLQNFAGGVIILLMKPFRVGDYIECGSYKGYVKEIRIFHTMMRPFNGRNIIIPNSELATKSLINHTKEPVIRLDVVASVAYGTDIEQAKSVLWQVVKESKEVVWDPKEPSIVLSNLGDSSVDLTLWLWVKVEDYWTLWSHIREDIYNAFNRSGIEIPFPQVTVHTPQPKPSVENTEKLPAKS